MEKKQKIEIIKMTTSLIFILISVFLLKENQISNILLIISYLIVGLDIIIEAIKNLFKKNIIEENTLMTIATIGAICINELPEAVAVMLFYNIGEFASDLAVNNSKKHIKELMDIRPDYANLKKDNTWIKVKPEEVKVGQIILIKPGEKIPLDGIIIKGESTLDTTSLTGESLPKAVKKNDIVNNGCINQTGAIEIKTTSLFKESTVSKILDLVENANNQKAEREKFITKFAKIYTPVVVFLAILITIIPPIITNIPFKIWLYRGLSFLVISCPCALVISIPLSFFAGIGIAAKYGILMKGSNSLESLTKTKKIIFDKTGTLTEGTFKIQKIITLHLKEEELLEILAYAEYHSNHPIASSIKERYNKKINIKEIKEIKELSGLGIKANIFGKEVLVGNNKLMEKFHIQYNQYNDIGTIIYIAINNIYEGTIIINDKEKENVKETLNILKKQYHIETILLTGDKEEIAKSISKKLNIKTYYSELLPHQKVEKIQELMKYKKENEQITFIGDGMNDAPALALSDLGIAMGGIGSDAAIEASDIVIMNDDISKIIPAFLIANHTLKVVKENIIFAISIKIMILLLSVIGITTMWSAVFADVGVSIITILNSLKILKNKYEIT